MTAVEAIGELFAGPGARDYLGEPVTIGTHMLQAGALAEAAEAGAALVAPPWCTRRHLLHDLGPPAGAGVEPPGASRVVPLG